VTPIFDTATDTATDMERVEHAVHISKLQDFLFVGPVWCIQSIVLTLKDDLAVTRWYFNVFCVSVDKRAYSI